MALFSYWSQAQTQQLFMVCTPHLNELNRLVPMPFIFQKDNNYCAYIGDNSAQVIEDGIAWLLNHLTEAFVLEEEVELPDPLESDNQAFVEYSQDGSSPKDKTGYPDLPSWCKENQKDCLNGLRHYGPVAEEAMNGWLDAHLKFWDVSGLWDEDMEVE